MRAALGDGDGAGVGVGSAGDAVASGVVGDCGTSGVGVGAGTAGMLWHATASAKSRTARTVAMGATFSRYYVSHACPLWVVGQNQDCQDSRIGRIETFFGQSAPNPDNP